MTSLGDVTGWRLRSLPGQVSGAGMAVTADIALSSAVTFLCLRVGLEGNSVILFIRPEVRLQARKPRRGEHLLNVNTADPLPSPWRALHVLPCFTPLTIWWARHCRHRVQKRRLTLSDVTEWSELPHLALGFPFGSWVHWPHTQSLPQMLFQYLRWDRRLVSRIKRTDTQSPKNSFVCFGGSHRYKTGWKLGEGVSTEALPVLPTVARTGQARTP